MFNKLSSIQNCQETASVFKTNPIKKSENISVFECKKSDPPPKFQSFAEEESYLVACFSAGMSLEVIRKEIKENCQFIVNADKDEKGYLYLDGKPNEYGVFDCSIILNAKLLEQGSAYAKFNHEMIIYNKERYYVADDTINGEVAIAQIDSIYDPDNSLKKQLSFYSWDDLKNHKPYEVIKPFGKNTNFSYNSVAGKNVGNIVFKGNNINVEQRIKDILQVIPKINYINETYKISNEHYTGNNYSMKINDGVIEITDKKTNKKERFKFDKLFYDMNVKEKSAIKVLIASLPPEVVLDVCKEVTFVNDDKYFDKEENATVWGRHTNYNSSKYTDNVALRGIDVYNFVHELGHAVEYIKNKKDAYSSFSTNKEYQKVWEKEMTAYKEAGNKDWATEPKNSNYFTLSMHETFADCYALLMLGFSHSEKDITTYFPKTFANVKKQLEIIRAYPQKYRH